MDFLYSLYDAFVSINVPSDKARAVVDAMERDMGTTLATKKDLEVLNLATKQDLEILALATKQDFEILRREIETLRNVVSRDIETFRNVVSRDIETLRSDVSRDLAALDLKMTVKLGSMLFVGFSLTIASLRLWG